MSLLVSLVLPALCLAQVVPTAPGPGQIFKTGEQCTIEWHPSTTGARGPLAIDLMSGSNDNMSLVTNVASGLDGSSLSSYTWTCPQVYPNAAIYFYQFSERGDTTSAWTTRFAIASVTDKFVTPEHSTQPNGDAIPWGIGHLTLADAEETAPSTTRSAGKTKIAEMALPVMSSSKSLPTAEMDVPQVTLNIPPARLRSHARRFGASKTFVQDSLSDDSLYRTASSLPTRKGRSRCMGMHGCRLLYNKSL